MRRGRKEDRGEETMRRQSAEARTRGGQEARRPGGQEAKRPEAKTWGGVGILRRGGHQRKGRDTKRKRERRKVVTPYI